jgi:hypothetical protein
VTITRSRETIGDEIPRPRIAAFHATFFVSLHSVGRPRSGETPEAAGPRQCGQSSARTVTIDTASNRARGQARFMA